ncbi:MAG: 3-deoxy-D-manno-octulosonic acid transferase [Alphaproteobacteria bacterium]|nr:3-deoxy-D-manno-octulosonic acid transferase [Alphaproteobacteria bacterium]
MISLFLYRFFWIVLSPFLALLFFIRWLKGKEDHKRFKERLGCPGCVRPAGHLIWMHGASVGECLSMLPLIQKLLVEDENLHIMVTSGTVTSANLMAKRLPSRAFHHYCPIDFPGSTSRLIRHFKPEAVFWFESEFWPNALYSFKKASVPLILLNGRISDRSFKRWKKLPFVIRPLLSCFALTLGQSPENESRLKKLGSPETACVGNIKCAAPASPYSKEELEQLKAQIGKRPCWCGASTHNNEEEMMANIHLHLKNDFPTLLTICVPRHPDRAENLEIMFKKKGLTVARRSKKQPITAETQVYLADTIGEMGLIYQLAPLVFVGGSLIKFGGQNMLEPMYWGKAVFVGPHAFNFRAFMSEGKKQKALREIPNAPALQEQIRYFLMHPDEAQKLGQRAHRMAISEMAVLDRLYKLLIKKGFIHASSKVLG